MSKNKFDRNPVPDSVSEFSVPDSIPEVSVLDSIPEVSVPKINPETEKPVDTNDGLHANEITSNPNLLINPDFKINQRGLSTYDSAAASSGHVCAEGYKSVRLRKEPNENAEVVTTVPVGENVLMGETINGWTKVNWSSFSGWMMDKYIVRH